MANGPIPLGECVLDRGWSYLVQDCKWAGDPNTAHVEVCVKIPSPV